MPVITLSGPRQSGKTTLVKNIFKNYSYTSMENPDDLAYAKSDPRGFLAQSSQGLIIDEAQNNPELFSYIQGIVDEENRASQFILTGSSNFQLIEKITQSLAGRSALFYLSPFSYEELKRSKFANHSLDELMLQGFYPRIYDQELNPTPFYQDYIQLYVQRDLRQLSNIRDLNIFYSFLKLLAGRVGQLINYSSLSIELGIDHKTVKTWISLLETAFIVFSLNPHFKNFNKRLVKTGKLYFHDTGLLCNLLEIDSIKTLRNHYARGSIFENFVISELKKQSFNSRKNKTFYFWRDRTGNEVDLILEKEGDLIPVEIKSGKTITNSFFKGIKFFNKISERDPNPESYIIYTGDANQLRSNYSILSWKNISDIKF